MNCDQAFDAMTDPDGPDSPELSQHLTSCPRCRQMCETLEPALGLFGALDHEPMEVSERNRPMVGSPSVQMAQRVAARLTPSDRFADRQPGRRQLWGAIMAALAAGFLLSVGLSSLVPDARPSAPGAASPCTWLNRSIVPGDEQARTLTVTCVTCHLPRPATARQDHAGMTDFSQELEQLVMHWQQTVEQHAHKTVLIAYSETKSTHYV